MQQRDLIAGYSHYKARAFDFHDGDIRVRTQALGAYDLDGLALAVAQPARATCRPCTAKDQHHNEDQAGDQAQDVGVVHCYCLAAAVQPV